MHIRNLFILSAAIGTISLATSFSYAKSISDEDFVQKAAIANKFEIDSSNLALEKSQNDQVKSFAKDMVDDHTQAGEKLNIALQSSSASVELPDELDDKHQKRMDKLEALSGSKFDQQYVSMQTEAHKEAVSLFSNYSKKGQDKELRNFAAETLPTLRNHLKDIEQIKK